jgi:hypothetical protein
VSEPDETQKRSRTAEDRDRAADARDVEADARDAAATDREVEADAVLAAADERDVCADDRDFAANRRDMAANLKAFLNDVDDTDAFDVEPARLTTDDTRTMIELPPNRIVTGLATFPRPRRTRRCGQ